ncbi:hypothetical protein N7520_006938 [Penicillium odoratum]|uniref:uncharacterized protein n=1 Tax=Penicillium odoratum TaxID=1167516 RepID=UPI002546ECF7|nr:uncharacterized protein N7520_006938 [Penicillium odoratum]KAJ5759782.1 hypothetical protein N7520_006938 [Penicillium odoratum]
MKSFLALVALAALCNSAYSLREGTYKIRALGADANKVLTEVPGQPEIVFDVASRHPGQTWNFELDPENANYFLIQNILGAYINCESEGSLCTAGDEPTSYRPELVSEADKSYELVANGTGYFLRFAEGDKLKLAGYDQGVDQEFVFIKA